ncbi:hypothetical protein [Streptomyces niveus]|uniref:hypothetical protein n=1 Tax=Streptomyces niveus TaxID=193462 RepID=UPI0036764D6F
MRRNACRSTIFSEERNRRTGRDARPSPGAGAGTGAVTPSFDTVRSSASVSGASRSRVEDSAIHGARR